LIFILTTLKID